MRSAMVVLVCVGIVSASGCFYVAPVIPPTGGLFSQISAPLDVDLDKTELGSKQGSASTVAVLGLIAFGDASTQAAAQNGGLRTINHADYAFLNVLGVFQQFTTTVYGD